MFAINFYAQIIMLLPPLLRQPKMIAWLWVLVKPISNLYGVFLGDRANNIRKLSTTSQTVSLESLLNAIFNAGFAPAINNNVIDYTNGGIYIQNTPNAIPFQFVFGIQELQPPFYVYSVSDASISYLWSFTDYLQQLNFIVFVPASLPCDYMLLRQYIDYYKPTGRNYAIQTY
jgi:hypothetical protein